MSEAVDGYNYEATIAHLGTLTAQVFHSVVWMPTLRCPLRCGYCAARALPVDSHGRPANELKPEQWIELWQSAPRPIEQVSITGGEPGAYAHLRDVLAATEWPFTVDSNLFYDPVRWLPEEAWGRVRAINAGLHFHPDREEAQVYWQRLAWLRENLPDTAQVVCCYVATQRELPVEWEDIARRAEDCGAEVRPLTFDDSFLYRERVPVMEGASAELCAHGAWYLTVFPDSAAYRCSGHSYYAVQCLGRLATDGWGVIPDKAMPCHRILCTICDPGRPPWINSYEMKSGMSLLDGEDAHV